MSEFNKKRLSRKETDRLILIIKSYPILNIKSRRKSIQEEKARAWANIFKKFNENVPEEYRKSVNQLIKFYYNDKYDHQRSNLDEASGDCTVPEIQTEKISTIGNKDQTRGINAENSKFSFKVSKFNKKGIQAFTLPLTSSEEDFQNVIAISDARTNDDSKSSQENINDSDSFYREILEGSDTDDEELMTTDSHVKAEPTPIKFYKLEPSTQASTYESSMQITLAGTKADMPKKVVINTRNVRQQVNFFKKNRFSHERDCAILEKKILYYKKKAARAEWRYSQLKLKMLRSVHSLNSKSKVQDKIHNTLVYVLIANGA